MKVSDCVYYLLANFLDDFYVLEGYESQILFNVLADAFTFNKFSNQMSLKAVIASAVYHVFVLDYVRVPQVFGQEELPLCLCEGLLGEVLVVEDFTEFGLKVAGVPFELTFEELLLACASKLVVFPIELNLYIGQ